ncbi:Guanyl-specific ribonuclease T1 [Lachnellula suecica]|uniref:ribonuclease T1 n=1 Tax=Lachnellula suecica TaxID=602035 RepID=A0A8T9BZ78_9HELO|nr:Guanyl-specific ribonuclease T1 [Lachnellula suecica]
MQFTSSLIALAFTLTATTAIPHNLSTDSADATCVYTCGKVCYYQSDVDAAVKQGYMYYSEGEQVGSNDYPHTENNYEGIDFYVSGPYEEFPILSSYKVYTGGSPGADRVVFNTGGKLAGVVTHTGASGDDFVTCSGCCA